MRAKAIRQSVNPLPSPQIPPLIHVKSFEPGFLVVFPRVQEIFWVVMVVILPASELAWKGVDTQCSVREIIVLRTSPNLSCHKKRSNEVNGKSQTVNELSEPFCI